MNTIGIEYQHANKLVENLNDLLSNYQLYYQNLRGFHWNISGPGFFELHAKFEELYNEANLAIDEIAERILTLEGKPFHTFEQYLEGSEIKSASAKLTAPEMVAETVSNLKTLIQKERQIATLASEANDEGTIDLVTGFISAQEKVSWMLRAYNA